VVLEWRVERRRWRLDAKEVVEEDVVVDAKVLMRG
jgi:hypothetical protein